MIDAVATTTRVARDLNGAVLAYARLTKPRIVILLVVTTIPAMMLADRGFPSPWLILATVFGGSVVAGGANAMNMYFDRDIDQLMLRTRDRPVPAGQIEPEKAALFGLALAAAGFFFLQWTVNLLAAGLTLGAFAFYVLIYTLILKRKTPLNIVIGGAAGAMPPVIGWAAVTGEVAVPALIMFAIVTIWTPPHFWALSLNYSSDYQRAGVPMLPVVAGPDETRRQILLVLGRACHHFPASRPLERRWADLSVRSGVARRRLPLLRLPSIPRVLARRLLLISFATQSSTWRCFSARSPLTRW